MLTYISNTDQYNPSFTKGLERVQRILLLFAVITILAITGDAQTVYQKDRWGAKLYYMQDNTIRMKDRWGEQLLWYDAANRQVRIKDRWGQPVLYMDGETVRQKDRWGAPLLYLDGQTIRQKDRWGAPVYYFDFTPEWWQVASVVLM